MSKYFFLARVLAMPILESKFLRKEFEDLVAVRDVSLSLEKGNVLALVGPNGAGKSTWLKMITGLLRPTSGTAVIDGIDLIDDPRGIHRKIGFLPDFFGLYDELTVSQYLEYFCLTYKIPKSSHTEVIQSCLKRVNLISKINSPIEHLSRGMKQRLGIARSLVQDPPLLILDEPTSGLDPDARHDLHQLFLQLSAMGKTLIVSSHVLTELQEYCSHVAVIQTGKLLSFGTIEKFLNQGGKTASFDVRFLGLVDAQIQELQKIVADYGTVTLVKSEHAELELTLNSESQYLLLKDLLAHGFRVHSFALKQGSISEAYVKATRRGPDDV